MEKQNKTKGYFLSFLLTGLMGLLLGGMCSGCSLLGSLNKFKLPDGAEAGSNYATGYVIGYFGSYICCPIAFFIIFGLIGLLVYFIITRFKQQKDTSI